MALAKVDSKGRLSLPREIRELLGDIVELKPVGREKVLISKAKKSRISKGRYGTDNLSRLFDTEPRRTGKPENPSPSEMKSIWNE
ncbi:MAG: AbrB/MazE/SpoVT family DNA-binding domain-containing protein [Nitrososphaerales archaeon]